jgi:MFS family permease
MTANETTKPPMWFWIVSVLALLWNLMGVYAYLMDAYMKDEMMASYSEAQKAIFETQPTWLTAAYAIGVFAGALGCIGLLIRKKWAKPVFVLSLLAVLARTLYYFFMTDATKVFDMIQGTILPIVVIIVSGLLIILARIAEERKWIR